MRISRLFVVVAILAAILAPAPSEAQSPWRTRALINEHARYYQGNYRPLFVLPPMYGGRYGSPYETPYYGNSGGRFGLDGRTLGVVVGGIAGGTALRRKGPVGQALGVVGGALVGGIIGNRFDRNREMRLMVEPPVQYEPEPMSPPTPQYEAQRGEVWINATGCEIAIDGVVIPSGKKIWVSDPEEVDWESLSCEVVFTEQEDGIVVLTCEKEK